MLRWLQKAFTPRSIDFTDEVEVILVTCTGTLAQFYIDRRMPREAIAWLVLMRRGAKDGEESTYHVSASYPVPKGKGAREACPWKKGTVLSAEFVRSELGTFLRYFRATTIKLKHVALKGATIH